MSEVQAMISNNKIVISDDRLNIDNYESIIQNKTIYTDVECYALLERVAYLNKNLFLTFIKDDK